MAPSKPAVDFNEIINKERQRKKNEALAQRLFGKNRRASAPGGGVSNRKNGVVPGSLASRVGPVGVTKRAVSTSMRPAARAANKLTAGNLDGQWTHDLHSLNNPAAQQPPRGPRGLRTNRNTDRMHSALNGSASSPALRSQFNIVGSAKPNTSISIRGIAGPYPVIIKNLAKGTTAADAESAMVPLGGVVLSCRLIAVQPQVIAEVVFETKEGADNVVDTLNNQNADGNVLHVYHKTGPVSSTVKPAHQLAPAPRPVTPLGPRGDDGSRSGYGSSDRYTQRERERSRDRRDYDRRDDVQDGSYGFNDDRMDTDDRREEKDSRGLYSDNMIGSRGRGGGSWDRGRGDNRDRGRGYDRR